MNCQKFVLFSSEVLLALVQVTFISLAFPGALPRSPVLFHSVLSCTPIVFQRLFSGLKESSSALKLKDISPLLFHTASWPIYEYCYSSMLSNSNLAFEVGKPQRYGCVKTPMTLMDKHIWSFTIHDWRKFSEFRYFYTLDLSHLLSRAQRQFSQVANSTSNIWHISWRTWLHWPFQKKMDTSNLLLCLVLSCSKMLTG